MRLGPDIRVHAERDPPRLHSQPRVIEIDEMLGPKPIAALQAMGHIVVEKETVCSFNFFNPVGIAVSTTGDLVGDPDPCLPGAAVGLGGAQVNGPSAAKSRRER